jgi:hypothetical protein
MKKFRIDITKTEYQGRVFYIEAETIEEAEALALEQAPDEIFDTDADADYEVFYSEEINN